MRVHSNRFWSWDVLYLKQVKIIATEWGPRSKMFIKSREWIGEGALTAMYREDYKGPEWRRQSRKTGLEEPVFFRGSGGTFNWEEWMTNSIQLDRLFCKHRIVKNAIVSFWRSALNKTRILNRRRMVVANSLKHTFERSNTFVMFDKTLWRSLSQKRISIALQTVLFSLGVIQNATLCSTRSQKVRLAHYCKKLIQFPKFEQKIGMSRTAI